MVAPSKFAHVVFNTHRYDEMIEPPRVCRRLVGLSYAAVADLDALNWRLT